MSDTDIGALLRERLSDSGFQKFLAMELVDHDATLGTVILCAPWHAGYEREPGTKQ